MTCRNVSQNNNIIEYTNLDILCIFIVIHYFRFLKSKNKPRLSNVSFDVNTRTKMKTIPAEFSEF